MKRILALLLVLVLALTAFVGCKKDKDPVEKDYTLAIGVVVAKDADTCEVVENAAVIVTDKDGKIVLCRLDCIEYKLDVDMDAEEIVTTAPVSKVALGEDYDKKNYMAAGDWYKQAAALETYVVGKTQSEVAAIALDSSGKVTDTELKASCSIGVSALLAAIDAAFESEHKVSFKSTATAFTAGLNLAASIKENIVDEEDEYSVNAEYTVEYAAAVLADGKVVAAILDTAVAKLNNLSAEEVDEDEFAFSAESISYPGTKREQGDAYDSYSPMPAGRWYEQADAYASAAVGLTKDNIASLASSGVAGCTIYAGGYKAGLEAAVKAAR